jgi:hypothetical protein
MNDSTPQVDISKLCCFFLGTACGEISHFIRVNFCFFFRINSQHIRTDINMSSAPMNCTAAHVHIQYVYLGLEEECIFFCPYFLHDLSSLSVVVVTILMKGLFVLPFIYSNKINSNYVSPLYMI